MVVPQRTEWGGASFVPFRLVPLEGLEPPTVCLGRNCSSIELQRLARQV